MIKKAILFVCLTTCVLGCNKDNENINNIAVNSNNTNANNTKANKVYGRLEFPQLKDPTQNQILIYKTGANEINFCVEWNNIKRTQRWSCYQLYKSNLRKATKRYYTENHQQQYPYDPSLSSQFTIKPDPYWGTGYDHGHICPSADRLNSYEANKQTFYMTNMQPQLHQFNAGVWLEMENKVRQWGTQNNYSFADTLYVCKGGTIDNASQYSKGNRGIIVPKYFFMAILRVKNNQYNAMGFWVEHTNNTDSNLAKYAVSIQELERRTGIDFFCNLPDARERNIESAPVNLNLWGLH